MPSLERLCLTVVESPQTAILISASTAFIISYPFLYAVFSQALPTVPIISSITDSSSPSFYVKQLYIAPSTFSTLTNASLLALQPLFDLTAGLPPLQSTNELSSLLPSLPYLHSIPLNLSLAHNAPQSIINSLLHNPRIVNDTVKSANGILLSFIYNHIADGVKWDSTLQQICNLAEQSLPSSIKHSVKLPIASSLFSRAIPAIAHSFYDLLGLFCCLIILIFYLAVSWDNIRSVRSKLGLLIAFIVQYLLSFCAAITTITLSSPSFDANSIRNNPVLPVVLLLITLEILSRLLNALSTTPPENPPIQRITVALTQSAPAAIILTVSNCAFLLIATFFLPPQLASLCLFSILVLIYDLALHLTYFTAILSVDLHRLELEDLIFSSSDNSITLNSSDRLLDFSFYHSKTPSTNRIRLNARLYILCRQLLLDFKVPISTLANSACLLFMILRRDKKATVIANATFFMAPLLGMSDISTGMVSVYEPLIFQEGMSTPTLNNTSGNLSNLDNFGKLFKLASQLHSNTTIFTRLLSTNLLLEFTASLSFILSLTGVILKFMLPQKSLDTTVQPKSDVLQFYSKDLLGYHSLDVLQIVIQGSIIATVSLDHKAYVWNAVSAPGSSMARPVAIPLSAEFWPVSRVVLSPSSSVIAVFSCKLAAIKSWNFKTNTLQFYVTDKALFSKQPTEAFFSGSDLICVTKGGCMAIINETGVISRTPIVLDTVESQITSAKRMLTPRLPERVICLTDTNRIFVGTHVGKFWKFRGLVLREFSMTLPPTGVPYQGNNALAKTGLNGSSKYSAPYNPSPQRALANLKNAVIIVPVQALNMVLVSTPLDASLFDVQTGTIVRHFNLGHFKPQTMRVFHSKPTHCRFCGCISVESLSVAYSDAEEQGLVICHTLTIDNRAKNNICLRVERDPRETRCLGFEASTERQHWIGNVEGWETTDMNMIMGVRRKEAAEGALKLLDKSNNKKLTGALSTSSYSSLTTLHSRRNRKPPPLNITWEGWAMSATGQISFYDIPDVKSSDSHNGFGIATKLFSEMPGSNAGRLLIKSIGPVTKYGSKSIAVAFGNIIKVLYFGNEETILNEVEEQVDSNPRPVAFGGAKKWRRGGYQS